MEVNISHRSRQEILNTADLAHPTLFSNALNELMQLMKMVCYFPQVNAILLVSFSCIMSEYAFLPSRIWQKITGHPCTSWSSKKTPVWDPMAMGQSRWRAGTSLLGWVLYMVLMIPFTKNSFLRAQVSTLIIQTYN